MSQALDLETAIHRVVGRLLKAEGFRLPVHVASVAANGAVLFTRFEEAPPGSPPGTVSSEHITGDVDDAGFLAPVQIMVTDASGRVRLARQGRSGRPVILEVVEPEDE